MTNYEWLVKSGELADFLQNITIQFHSDRYMTAHEKAAAYLQNPHTEKYIKTSAVYDAINKCYHGGYFSDTTLLTEIRLAEKLYGKVIEDDT